MKENMQNNNFNYNDWAKDNNQWHFHIGKTGLIIICIVAFIAILGSGAFDTDEPSETTDSTPKQTTVSQDTVPPYIPNETTNSTHSISKITLSLFSRSELEMNIQDEYTGHFYIDGDYTFDDIVFISENKDIVSFECNQESEDYTLRYKIKAIAPGTSTLYIQTIDEKIISEKITVTVLETSITNISWHYNFGPKIELQIGESIEKALYLESNGIISENHIILFSSNENVVTFEYVDYRDVNTYSCVDYKLTALSEGECIIYAQNIDGSVKSSEIKITVTGESITTKPIETTESEYTYVLNTNTMVFHYSSCRYADKISSANKSTFTGTRSEIIRKGYDPCGHCDP